MFGRRRREERERERVELALSLGLRCDEGDMSTIDRVAYTLLPMRHAHFEFSVLHGRLESRDVRQFEWLASKPADPMREIAGLPSEEVGAIRLSVATVALHRSARRVAIAPPRSGLLKGRTVQPTGNAWLDEWFVCETLAPEVAQAIGDATFVHRFGQLPHGSGVELTGRELVAVHPPLPTAEITAFLRAAVALADVVPVGCFRTDIE